MSKRTLLRLIFAAAALAPTLPEAQVYFWRDSHNIANYAGLCPVGVYCGVKSIRLHHNAAVASAAGGVSAGYTTIASTTPEVSTAPMNLAGLGGGGMRGASGSSPGGGGAIGGGSGGGGGVTSASASLQTQPRAAPATSTPSTPAPSTPVVPPSPPSAPSDAQPSVIAAYTPAATTPSGLRSPIGTNLDGIAYWSPQIPFVDVMKSSSAWISGDSTTWDNGKSLDLDANGWVRSLQPGQIARKLTLREIRVRGGYPGGQYVVRYKGQGTLNFAFAAKVIAQRPGEMLLQVTPDQEGIYITITETNPANYLRDIQVFMPGGVCQGEPFTHITSPSACGKRAFLSFADNPQILFYPVFANRLRNYSVLRFMDWMATNNSPVVAISQVTPMSSSTWMTPNGAPIEMMIALANLIGAHPWFNIPHQADDTYVRNLAVAIQTQLDPALKVYVEHSNEVWNSIFSQSSYVTAQGKLQTPPIDGIQYHALRTRAIGQIFKATLGDTRVVTVLGAQAALSSTAERGFDYLKARLGNNAVLGIDAVAIAPYFGSAVGPAEAEPLIAMTMDDFFRYVRASELPKVSTWITAYRRLVTTRNVRLIAYEGGQHMVGIWGAENSGALNALFDAFNRDPRMKQLYLDYLSIWKGSGGELFVHFNDVTRYTKSGRWGALEYIAQPRAEAPKFDALQTFIEQTPIWWQ